MDADAGPIFCYWVGCALFVLAIESSRRSKISDSIDHLDPLDLVPYQPLVKQGLTNAFLMVGMGTILSFFMIESGVSIVVLFITSLFSVFAWIGLVLLCGVFEKNNVCEGSRIDTV
jgi:hypothetical protein